MYYIESSRQKWINHLDRMPDEGIPTQVLKYKPTGCGDGGRSWDKWNE
jgi:hypothetical protein